MKGDQQDLVFFLKSTRAVLGRRRGVLLRIRERDNLLSHLRVRDSGYVSNHPRSGAVLRRGVLVRGLCNLRESVSSHHYVCGSGYEPKILKKEIGLL